MTSIAIVGLNAFLDSSYLPKEGLGGCSGDSFGAMVQEVLFSSMFRTQYIDLHYILVNLVHVWLSYVIMLLLLVIWFQLHMLETYIKLFFAKLSLLCHDSLEMPHSLICNLHPGQS